MAEFIFAVMQQWLAAGLSWVEEKDGCDYDEMLRAHWPSTRKSLEPPARRSSATFESSYMAELPTREIIVLRIHVVSRPGLMNGQVNNARKVLLPILTLECRLLQILPTAGSIATKLESSGNPIDEGRQRISWPMIDNGVFVTDDCLLKESIGK